MLTQKSSPLIEKMAPGHLINRGHELVAHLESTDGETWKVVRECCTGNVADRHVEDMTLDDVQKSLAEMPDGATGSPMHKALVARLRTLQNRLYRVRMNGWFMSQFNEEDAAHRFADSLAENYPDRKVTVRTEEVAA